MIYDFLLGSSRLGQIFWLPPLLDTGGIGKMLEYVHYFVPFLMVNK